MNPAPRQIVVLGAPGSGAEALRQQLRQALAGHSGWLLTDESWPSRQHQFALLMGLDQLDTAATDRADRAAQARIDAQLRQQLQALDLPFRVVYGQGPARLTHALLALDLPVPDEAARQSRQDAQFDLNRGRTPWSCESCSDPDCEHRLFTGLLRQNSP